MIRNSFFALCLIACGTAASAPITVTEFQKLPIKEQDRILEATKDALSVAVFFLQLGDEREGKKTLATEFNSCLKDRDVDWVRKSFREYVAEFGDNIGTTAGGSITHTLMWKCGYLQLEKPSQ